MAEENTSTLLIMTSHGHSGRMARWSEAAPFRWRKFGCNWVPSPACLLQFFFSFIVFYPLAFYCLFSLLTPLASRDFCETVFLVLCTKIASFHHIDAFPFFLWIRFFFFGQKFLLLFVLEWIFLDFDCFCSSTFWLFILLQIRMTVLHNSSFALLFI